MIVNENGCLLKCQNEYRISSFIRWIFFFQNNPKDLDPSCKMDLVFLGVFRKGKTCIITKFHRTDLDI